MRFCLFIKFELKILYSLFPYFLLVCKVCTSVRTVGSRGFVCGKNNATPLAFLLNVNVASHFNSLFSSPNLFHRVPQRTNAYQLLRHLTDEISYFGLRGTQEVQKQA